MNTETQEMYYRLKAYYINLQEVLNSGSCDLHSRPHGKVMRSPLSDRKKRAIWEELERLEAILSVLKTVKQSA